MGYAQAYLATQQAKPVTIEPSTSGCGSEVTLDQPAGMGALAGGELSHRDDLYECSPCHTTNPDSGLLSYRHDTQDGTGICSDCMEAAVDRGNYVRT